MARKQKITKNGYVSHQGEYGGRKTKFKPEYIQEIIEFFSIEPYRKELIKFAKEYYTNGKVKKESSEHKLVPNKLPTLFSFARKIGVDYSTVYRWAEKGEDEPETEEALLEQGIAQEQIQEILDKQSNLLRFRKAFNEAKQLQKEFLISIGLAGAAPPAAFIFTAKNITDMRDTHETKNEHILRDFKDLKDEELDREIARLKGEIGETIDGEEGTNS